jgi:hypothetical protein
MHRRLALGLFAFLLSICRSPAETEVLRYLASLSDVVLVGTVVTAPDMASGSSPLPSADPKPYWLESVARVRIDRVLKGTYEDSKSPLITLRIPFVAAKATRPSLSVALEPFRTGTQKIFFLQDRRSQNRLGKGSFNGEEIRLVAFDPYFSAQPYSEALELEVRKRMK